MMTKEGIFCTNYGKRDQFITDDEKLPPNLVCPHCGYGVPFALYEHIYKPITIEDEEDE